MNSQNSKAFQAISPESLSLVGLQSSDNRSSYFKDLRSPQQTPTNDNSGTSFCAAALSNCSPPSSCLPSANSQGQNNCTTTSGQASNGLPDKTFSNASSASGVGNSTSFFVSFASEGNQRESNCLSACPAQRDIAAHSSSTSASASVRRQDTFKQNNPAMLSSSQAAFSSSSATATSANLHRLSHCASNPNQLVVDTCSSTSFCDSNPVSSSDQILIDLYQSPCTSSSSAAASYRPEPSTSHACGGVGIVGLEENGFGLSTEDLTHAGDGDLDIDEEECTPPPSYAEVLEDAHLNSTRPRPGPSNEACGTL